MARAPRCWMCQSSPSPSVALYWHIGATAMRFRAVTERKLIGSNSFGVVIACSSAHDHGKLPLLVGVPLQRAPIDLLRRRERHFRHHEHPPRMHVGGAVAEEKFLYHLLPDAARHTFDDEGHGN